MLGISPDHWIICALIVVNIGYIYLLSTKVETDFKAKNFVIKEDTKANFDLFLKTMADSKSNSGNEYSENISGKWEKDNDKWDDFAKKPINFDPAESNNYYGKDNEKSSSREDDFYLVDSKKKSAKKSKIKRQIIPSVDFLCKEGYVTIRSSVNYKYMWMVSSENSDDKDSIMDSSATYETPVHMKAFEVVPVNSSCDANKNHGGWVLLRAPLCSLELTPPPAPFIFMRSPRAVDVNRDEWLVKTGVVEYELAITRPEYYFLLEKEGYLLNMGSMAFVNNIAGDVYTDNMKFSVRGHTEAGDRTEPAYREYGASMEFTFIEKNALDASVLEDRKEQKELEAADARYIETIKAFPASQEKRVISFGLYGQDPKYTQGAVRNAKLRDTYFPGWTCRFYVTSDVPSDIIARLEGLGSEVRKIPSGQGYTAGMFYRFLVAADPTVDRFIVRDTDSRLNARDRLAVQEWIESGKAVHIIRDHVNHCRIPMNGGMWGAVRGSVPDIETLVDEWSTKDRYAADLSFLEEKVWPVIKKRHIAHDSYCCDRFPRTKPFPSRRPANYQHVGQVFDAQEHPRQSDIDGFIRGVPVPSQCRKQSDWIYG